MVIRTADLFSVATSGLRASNQLLDTTGHNIANVNTEGFVRERTTFATQVIGGVGRATTERIINVFAQNQLRRDTTSVGEHEAYYNRASTLDDLFASEANSISNSMSRFFGSLQTASDEPTNMAARQLVLGEANSLVGQIGTLAGFLEAKEKEFNLEMESLIERANTLIENIADLNGQIRTLKANNRFDEPGAVMNERDQAVMELAELLSIETRENGTGDGSLMINLTSGESLVLEDGSFNLFQLGGNPDLNYKSLMLDSTGKPTALRLAETDVGGTIGGLFRYRDEILEPAQRELGQIALSLTAAMNEQNRLGMDFDLQLGGDIFGLPTFSGLPYQDNADTSLVMNGRVAPDGASSLTSADYQITIDAVNPGAPNQVDITVTLLNPDGTQVEDASGNPITQSYTNIEATAGVFSPVLGGIEVEFPNGASYTAGDQFLLQPTKETADEIEVVMTRPEDLALASPFRVDSDLANTGDVQLVSTTVTNTTVDGTLTDPDASAFDGAGGLVAGTPARIVFNSATEFEVFDEANNSLVVVTGVTDYNNMMAQAAAAAGWPFGGLNDFPGYDFSMQGTPKVGDSFTIAYNTDGVNDNRNALELADLQNRDIMSSSNSSSANQITFHEGYANIVSDIGEKTSRADIALQAAEAMKKQSSDWFDSISGVNLDEEAANLVRFQQTYAASARILTAAQTIFDTILNSTR
ncbi:flagellar hook-associated protein FlgK [Aestuariibacter halophilus]|uniref:Flagellar hook-associated protein 1 n=1 Tax=Fluctibacter halophilus TaxID=226011 RepID=A0ABS8G786_9ALTE|nr:flagellar hook-associated protein FlgK [Aestuariibacter halophilus]MCC2615091.1 flagellar hook-associated protein FlgK [Aestuariibacter halophilus]